MFFPMVAGLALGVLSSAATEVQPRTVSLEVLPKIIRLIGAEASQRLVVVGVFEDGSRRDLSNQARYESQEPRFATVDPQGVVHPVADGATHLVVRVGQCEANVTVEVKAATDSRPVSFRRGVEPVLTKLGCNQGACHGAQHGKGGFKLSLLGFESEPDYSHSAPLFKGL